MSCTACAARIESAKRLAEVEAAYVNFATASSLVRHTSQLDTSAIVQIVTQLGYQVHDNADKQSIQESHEAALKDSYSGAVNRSICDDHNVYSISRQPLDFGVIVDLQCLVGRLEFSPLCARANRPKGPSHGYLGIARNHRRLGLVNGGSDLNATRTFISEALLR